MTHKDPHGLPLSGANAASATAYDRATALFRCYVGDPVAAVDEAIGASPGFVMAHALKAYLHLLGTEVDALPVARACLEAARQHKADAREQGHLTAIGHLIEGRWHDASRALQDVAIEQPRDLLALQTGHQIDFFTGESRMLRDRIARALPAWSQGMPGYHAMLGMHAFGLGEAGDYARAEAQGRKAAALERRDGWAWHAVAHVLEMQGRQKDGIAWMRGDTAAWSEDSFFKVHNWWHLALYHLDLGEIDQVLALYNGPIYGTPSPLAMDMLDASAMMWRLALRGIDVGDRWNAVADGWTPMARAGIYAFNDMHAMMAFVGAGRTDLQKAVLESQAAVLKGQGDNVMFTRDVGHAATKAIKAFGDGDYKQTIELIRPIRNRAARFGGSHAQRDLLDLTLIEAALRAGEYALARALTAERLDVKPTSPFNRRLVERATGQAKAV